MLSNCSERSISRRLGFLAVASVVLTGCDRIGNDPISWLTVIIAAAAALAFYFQVLKDW